MADRRATVLVLDACGVGALPDAADYGEEATSTEYAPLLALTGEMHRRRHSWAARPAGR